MALAIARWLGLTATQGSADAFVEASVATDIVPEDGLILKVNKLEFQITNSLAALAADFHIFWSLTRDTKTAVADLSDGDTIVSDAVVFALTTSGSSVIPTRFEYNYSSGLYLVEPLTYLQLDSSSTGLSLVMDCRIYYEEVRATEVEILRIINNS